MEKKKVNGRPFTLFTAPSSQVPWRGFEPPRPKAQALNLLRMPFRHQGMSIGIILLSVNLSMVRLNPARQHNIQQPAINVVAVERLVNCPGTPMIGNAKCSIKTPKAEAPSEFFEQAKQI